MKLKYFLLTALTATACSNDLDVLTPNQNELNEITISAPDFQTDGLTRTSVQITSHGAVFTWAENDTIGIFPNEGGQVFFPMIQGAGTHSATFTGGGWALRPSSAYTAYYPLVDRLKLDKTNIRVSYQGQTQNGNGSTEHLGGYDFMAARVKTPQNGSANFQFGHLGSLFQIRIPLGEALRLKSLTLLAPDDVFVTEGKINLDDEKVQIIPVEKANHLVLDLQNVTTTADRSVAVLYVMMAPMNLENRSLLAKVRDDKNQIYDFKLNCKNFVAGHAYDLLAQKIDDGDRVLSEIVPGYAFNATLKNLCPADEVKEIVFETSSYRTDFSNPVSLGSSDTEAYAMNDNGKITVFTPAEEMMLNADCSGMFEGFVNLKKIDLYNVNTRQVKSMARMFANCQNLTALDLKGFNTNQLTDMTEMFYSCMALKDLDLNNFNTAKVTSFLRTFYNCRSLENLEIGSFDTQNVQDMGSMFDRCSSLKSLDLSHFNTAEVTNMWSMFMNCSALKQLDLSNFNTAKVKDMEFMFINCESLTDLNVSSFNTENVTNMWSMFGECRNLSSLDLSNFNTAKVKNMSEMFHGCSSLTTLNLSSFNTLQVNDMHAMFRGCFNLTDLDLSSFDTQNLKNAAYMFDYVSSLNTLDLGSSFVLGETTSRIGMCKAFSANTVKCTADTKLKMSGTETELGTSAVQNWVIYE